MNDALNPRCFYADFQSGSLLSGPLLRTYVARAPNREERGLHNNSGIEHLGE